MSSQNPNRGSLESKLKQSSPTPLAFSSSEIMYTAGHQDGLDQGLQRSINSVRQWKFTTMMLSLIACLSAWGLVDSWSQINSLRDQVANYQDQAEVHEVRTDSALASKVPRDSDSTPERESPPFADTEGQAVDRSRSNQETQHSNWLVWSGLNSLPTSTQRLQAACERQRRFLQQGVAGLPNLSSVVYLSEPQSEYHQTLDEFLKSTRF